MTPQPYRIAVSQKKLDTLKTKLALAEFPDELDESEWDMGVPLVCENSQFLISVEEGRLNTSTGGYEKTNQGMGEMGLEASGATLE